MHVLKRGSGPDTVVFLHGYPFRGDVWQPQLDALPAGWRGFAPDLPGYGRTPRGRRDPGMPAQAEWVVSLLDAQSVERAVICGLSMGGYIALAIVRGWPDRVAGLLLADTRAGADGEEARRRRWATAARLRAEGISALEPAMLDDLTSARTREERPEVVERIRDMILSTDTETLALAQEAMAARPDSTGLLGSIRVPSLVVVGEEDAITPPETARAMADAIPGAELRVLAGAGHVSNLEAPRQFNVAVHDLLRRVRATTGPNGVGLQAPRTRRV